MTNQVWAVDFVHDQLAKGRKLRILTTWIPSPGSRPQWTHRSATAVRML
jgi:hypothetical protein